MLYTTGPKSIQVIPTDFNLITKNSIGTVDSKKLIAIEIIWVVLETLIVIPAIFNEIIFGRFASPSVSLHPP